MAPRSFLAGALGALLLTTPGQSAAATSQAGTPWFQYETVQLTEASLAHLNKSQSAPFTSGNGSHLSSRSTGKCKTFPGDTWWPAPAVWDLFDALLGGALIKTVPLASSCYSAWPEYNSKACAAVTSNWTDSYLQ